MPLSKKNLIFFLLFFLLELTLTPLMFFEFKIGTLIGFVICFFITYLIFNKCKKVASLNIFIIGLIGLSIFQLPIRIINFNSTLNSLPHFLFHLLGLIFAYLVFISKKNYKVVFVVIAIILNAFYFFVGNKYYNNYLSFGSINNKINQQLNFELNYFDSTNRVVNLSAKKYSYYLIDFWHTRCGVCFQKFPIVEAFYQKEKSNKKIKIIAFNLNLKSDTLNQAFEVLKKENYHFENGIIQNDSILNKLEVKVYPTTLLIDSNGLVFFRGDISNAIKKLETFIH